MAWSSLLDPAALRLAPAPPMSTSQVLSFQACATVSVFFFLTFPVFVVVVLVLYLLLKCLYWSLSYVYVCLAYMYVYVPIVFWMPGG